MTRVELAALLGVSPSAVGNYETGVSFPKEEIMLRLFDALEVDPNTLFQDSFQYGKPPLSPREQKLLEDYRGLSALGRETVRTMVEALCACRDEAEEAPGAAPAPEEEGGGVLWKGGQSVRHPRRRGVRTFRRGKGADRQFYTGLWGGF